MKQENKIALTNGIAIFAMFFGSGNLIFPIALGSTAGSHLIPVWLAFLLTGVGLPFLGVFTMTLFKGDYLNFFAPLSKVLAFLLITFLILVLGPLFVAPRTETVTYGSFAVLFHESFMPHALFSAIYFFLVFLILVKNTYFTEILGKLLGPLKIAMFVVLILGALWAQHRILPNDLSTHSTVQLVTQSLTTGYNTMDLLAAFFFSGLIYQSILIRCQKKNIDFDQHATSINLKSCLVGAVLLALIYTGFFAASWFHAADLQGVSMVSVLSTLSLVVFGPNGAWFVCICVSLTCLATAAALTEISSHYFEKVLFKSRVPRLYCLIFTLVVMYAMSLLGFDKIMAIASPILNYLYPLLILYCLVRLGHLMLKKIKNNKELEAIS